MSGNETPKHTEIGPQELDAMLREGRAAVIDVREPDEFAAGHIPGAINIPLSVFEPSRIPHAAGKTTILNCLGGKRSALALEKCKLAGSGIDRHLAGGYGAWTAARLPVEH